MSRYPLYATWLTGLALLAFAGELHAGAAVMTVTSVAIAFRR